MKKIIIHSPFYPVQSGIANYSEELYKSLERYGGEYGFEIVKANSDFWKKYSGVVRSPSFSLKKLRKIFEEYKLYDDPGNIHHFHFSGNKFNLIFLEAFKRIKGKKIITVHDRFFYSKFKRIRKFEKYYKFISSIMKNAEIVIVHSKTMKDSLPKGVKGGIIKHGVDFEKYNKDKGEVKKELGLRGKVISSLGLLERYKHIEEFIKSIRFLLDNKGGGEITIIIVGEGPKKKELLKLNKKLNTNIRFLRAESDELFDKYIIASDIVAFTRKIKGELETSGVLVKAMSAGCCIVSYDSGSFKDYLLGGRGLLVKPNHFVMLGKEIKYLLKNSDKLRKVSEKAKNFAKKELSMQNISVKHLKLYQKILEKKERKGDLDKNREADYLSEDLSYGESEIYRLREILDLITDGRGLEDLLFSHKFIRAMIPFRTTMRKFYEKFIYTNQKLVHEELSSISKKYREDCRKN